MNNHELPFKQWIACTIAFSILFFGIVVLFNYCCSLRTISTTTTLLEKAAQKLLQGNPIAGLGDDKAYDDRLFQKILIQQMTSVPDMIVIGSSRSMMLRKKNMTLPASTNFFNHFLASASFEDAIAIIGMYEELQSALPKTIIFGIDPWVFNKKSFSEKWKSVGKYYLNLLRRIDYPVPYNNVNAPFDYTRLITLKYTMHNITTLGTTPLSFYVPTTFALDEFIRDVDGSVHMPLKIRNQSQEETMKIINESLEKNAYQRETFDALANVSLFEACIKHLQKESIVVFFLCPYHPKVYHFLSQKKSSSIMTVETYLRHFALHNNIQVIGSYDPNSYDLTTEDFFDGYHGHDSLVRKMLN